ncbi:MAG: type III secretion system export apparatus subunit SctT [Trinickia sp.]
MSPFLLQLTHLSAIVSQYAILLTISSIRLGVLMTIFPPTSKQLVQGTVRNGISLIWSSMIAYGQQAMMPELHGGFLIIVILKESIIGLALGYAASLVFWAAESAGTYIDDLTGYNNVQMSNPNGEQVSLTSTLLSQFAVAAFWLLGGMTFLLGAVYESYRWWPLASVTPIPSAILESFAIGRADTLMQMTAKLAGPVMLALVLIDIGFGIAGKASQKIDMQSLERPVKGLVTVLMLALLAAVFVDQVRGQIALTAFRAEAKGLMPGPK